MPDIEGGCKRDFRVVSLVPDVCKSPAAPVPYSVVARLTDSERTTTTVHFSGKGSSDTFTLNSRLTTLSGDEAGTGGGVISGVNRGWSRPINGSATVRAQGFGVVQEKVSLFWMNCAGPEGPGNTVGMLLFDRRSTSAAVGPDQADPGVVPETEAEAGFLDGMLGQLGLSTDGLGDLFEWGQKAYALSQVDWSNPAGVLGGIAGLAGIPGLGNLAGAAGVAQLGYNLATMDWRKPADYFSAIGGIAGLAGLSDVAKGAAGGVSAVPDWTDPAALIAALGPLARFVPGGAPPASPVANPQPSYALATTDWRNPGTIVGAAMSLAGLSSLDALAAPPLAPRPANHPATGGRTGAVSAPGLIATPPFTPFGRSDPTLLVPLSPVPGADPDLRADPVLQTMADRVWRPLPAVADPAAAPVRIAPDGSLTGPRGGARFPETPAERVHALQGTIARPLRQPGPAVNAVLAVDQSGTGSAARRLDRLSRWA